MSLTALPPLREALAEHGLLARKRFGQHFLLDLNVTRKIVRLAGPFYGAPVLEVGPGPGGLTRALAESDAGRIVAVEKDPRFLPLLGAVKDASPVALDIVEGDALALDERSILGAATEAHVVSNLPYNVGTPLLIKWLTGPWRPSVLTLMFQKEVAERIVASPGQAAYGRLAVIAQTVCLARLVMDLPARAFTPAPRVDSAVVRLTRLEPLPDDALLSTLERVTASAFGQRRKMLRSSLKTMGGEALCRAADVDPNARAESLSPQEFLALAAQVTG